MNVRREILVETDPRHVWEALTNPALLEQWLAEDVDIDPREGGRIRASDGGGGRTGLVERAEPPRLLVLRWWDEAGFGSTVAITVDAVARGSRVTVVETADWTPVAATMASISWGMRFSALAGAAGLVPVA
jgi:uncharacterized protein YndB with AHSA1/START domain